MVFQHSFWIKCSFSGHTVSHQAYLCAIITATTDGKAPCLPQDTHKVQVTLDIVGESGEVEDTAALP